MSKVRLHPSSERGHIEGGWLDAYHSFSFAEWQDPRFDNFESLRVINEDAIAPQSGFPTHPHKNYAIFTYILEGEITHHDSMGNTEVLGRGHVQFTNAGSGISHSESNEHPSILLRSLQIWVRPHTLDTKPYYETRFWSDDQKRNRWVLITSPNGAEGSIPILQNMKTWATIVDSKAHLELRASEPKRKAYVHLAMTGGPMRLVVDGEAEHILEPGDGAFVDAFEIVRVEAADEEKPFAEALLFEF